jgi:cytoskeletal protein RodZ
MMWQIQKEQHELTPSLEQQRAEKLAEIGAQLWTSRLEQGFSLEEMVISTKIPRRLLQAIEEGNLAELPEPVYIQGLIRQFADALGFNGAELSSSFPIGSSRVNLKPSWKSRPLGQLRPLHLYVLYIVLIVCSVSGLSQLLNTATWQLSHTQSKQLRQTENLQSTAIEKPQSQILQLDKYIVSSSNDTDHVEIGVTLKEKSWIRVVADGKVTYEGELPEGTHRIWKAQEQLTVRAGNAGGVLVSINQEKAKQMGEPGTVKEVTIAANTKS